MALDQQFEDQFDQDEDQFDQDEEHHEEGKEMTFIEHLEELRWHIIRAVGSILVFAIVAFIFIRDILYSFQC